MWHLVFLLVALLTHIPHIDARCNSVAGSKVAVKDSAPISEVCDGVGCRSDCSGPLPGYYISGALAPAKFPAVTSISPKSNIGSNAVLTLKVVATFPAAINPPKFAMRCRKIGNVTSSLNAAGTCTSSGGGVIVCTGVNIVGEDGCIVDIGSDLNPMPGVPNPNPDFGTAWTSGSATADISGVTTSVTAFTAPLKVYADTFGTCGGYAIGSVTITGAGFGSPGVFSGSSFIQSLHDFQFNSASGACNRLTVISDSEMVCSNLNIGAGTPAGIYPMSVWPNITYQGGGYADNIELIDPPSAAPNITAVSWPSLGGAPTLGGFIITLFGAPGEPVGGNVLVAPVIRAGGYPCLAPFEYSNDTITWTPLIGASGGPFEIVRCKMGPGVGANLTISFNLQTPVLGCLFPDFVVPDVLVSYDPPQVLGMSKVNTSSPFPRDRITITGTNFGPRSYIEFTGLYANVVPGYSLDMQTVPSTAAGTLPQINMGGSPCVDVMVHSDSQLSCTVPYGYSKSAPIEVTTRNLAGESASNFTWGPIEITAVTPASTLSQYSLLTLFGNGFGPGPEFDNTTDIRIGNLTGNVCRNVTWNSTVITCYPTPNCGTMPLYVLVQGASSGGYTVTYNIPAVSTVTPAIDIPTNGSASFTMTVTGVNFGPTWCAGAARILVWATATKFANIISWDDTAVIVSGPPTGTFYTKNSISVINSLAQVSTSTSVLITYLAPTFSLYKPVLNYSTSANSATLTIVGSGFGTLAANIGAAGSKTIFSVGGTACITVKLSSDTQITCGNPAGAGSVRNVALSFWSGVSWIVLSNAQTFSYAPPAISSLTPPPPYSTLGGNRVTLVGINFGGNNTVTVGGSLCTSGTLISGTSFSCLAPAGAGANLTVYNQADDQISPPYTLFAYSPPVFSGFFPAFADTYNTSWSITITGQYFGGPASASRVKLVPPLAPATNISCSIVNDTAIRCSAGPTDLGGYGRNVDVQVTVGIYSTLYTKAFTYNRPVTTAFEPAVMPFSGGLLTIFGSNFGSVPAASGIGVTFEDIAGNVTSTRPCASPVWVSHSMITCTMPSTDETLCGHNVRVSVPTGDPPNTVFDSTVCFPPSSNSTLQSITDSLGLTNPLFNPNVTSYGPLIVSAATATLASFSATCSHRTCTISIIGYGTFVGSGTQTNIPLSLGLNTLTLNVTAQDNVTFTTYTVVFKRLSFPPALTTLTDSLGAVGTAFVANVTSYPVAGGPRVVGYNTPNVGNIAATCSTPGCAICIGTGCSAFVPLSVSAINTTLAPSPAITTIPITVVAADGVTKLTYSLSYRRMSGQSGIVSIADNLGTIPAFALTTLTYTNSVNYTVSSVTLAITCAEPSTCVYLVNAAPASSTPTLNLNFGLNTISVAIGAEDPAAPRSAIYLLLITRGAPPSLDATLQSIVVSTAGGASTAVIPLIPTFAPLVTQYTADMPVSALSSAVSVVATCSEPNCFPVAAICPASTAVAGTLSCPVTGLVVSSATTVTFVITAANSSAPQMTYNVVINVPIPGKATTLVPLKGLAGITVTISGSGFGSAAAPNLQSIKLAGEPCATVTVVDDSTSICETPKATSVVGPKGAADLFLNSVVGPYNVTSTDSFTFLAPPPLPTPDPVAATTVLSKPSPVVQSVIPSSGPTSGGTLVTIIGTNLGVSLGDVVSVSMGLPCTSTLTYSSPSKLTCITAANSPVGPQNVVVRTGTGGSNLIAPVFMFIYPVPIISAANPRAIPIAGGATVTLRGKFFGASSSAVAVVQIDGQPCTKTTWVSETQVLCLTPPGTETPSSTRLMLSITVDGQQSLPVDVGSQFGFRYGSECDPICDWTQECSFLRDCNTCLPGFFGPGCSLKLFTIELLSAPFTSEDPGDNLAATGLITINGNTGKRGVTFKLTSSDPAEATVSPATIAFPPDTTGPLTAKFTMKGVDDGFRDGTRAYSVTVEVDVASSSQEYIDATANGASKTMFNLLNSDSSPVLSTIKPRAISLLGGKITLTGRNWDYLVYLNTTLGDATNITRLSYGDASRAPATYARMQALQVVSASPDSLEAVIPEGTTTGYAELTLRNHDGSSVTDLDLLYYTEDCPDEGYYGRGTDCQPCPEGAECPGGYRLWPKAGYWNSGEDSGFVRKCTPPEACLGGKTFSECAEGYEGQMCGECDTGYFRANNACQKCPKSGSIMIFIIADCILWTLFGIAGAVIKDRMTFSYCVMAVRSLQMLSGLGEASDRGLPKWVMVIYSILHMFSGDYSFAKPDCLGRVSYVTIFFTSLAYNVMIFFPLWTILLLARCFARDPARREYWKNRFIRTLVIWLVFAYQPITAKLFETVSCYKTGGKYVMITLPYQVCYDPTDHFLLTLLSSGAMIGYTIGFPIMFLVFLRKESNNMLLHRDERFMEKYNFLYEFYNPKHPYAWTAEFPIACVVAAGKSYLRPNINYQMIVSIIVFGLKLGYVIFWRPFIDGLTNFIQAIIALISMVAINMNFLQRHGVFDRVSALRTSLVIVFVVGLAISLACTLFMIVYLLLASSKKKKKAEALALSASMAEVAAIANSETVEELSEIQPVLLVDSAASPTSGGDISGGAPAEATKTESGNLFTSLWDTMMGFFGQTSTTAVPADDNASDSFATAAGDMPPLVHSPHRTQQQPDSVPPSSPENINNNSIDASMPAPPTLIPDAS